MNRVFAGYRLDTPVVKRQNAFTKLDFIRTRMIFRLLILGSFMVFLSLFYIWSRVQVVSAGYQINEYKKLRADLVNRNKLLKIELAHLVSPDRLKSVAQKSGIVMELPDQKRVLSGEEK